MRMPVLAAVMLLLVQLLQWTSTPVGAYPRRYLLATQRTHRATPNNWKPAPLRRFRHSKKPRRVQDPSPENLAGDLGFFTTPGHYPKGFPSGSYPYLCKETEVSDNRTRVSDKISCKHNQTGETSTRKRSKHDSDVTRNDVTGRHRVARRRARRSDDIIKYGPRGKSRVRSSDVKGKTQLGRRQGQRSSDVIKYEGKSQVMRRRVRRDNDVIIDDVSSDDVISDVSSDDISSDDVISDDVSSDDVISDVSSDDIRSDDVISDDVSSDDVISDNGKSVIRRRVRSTNETDSTTRSRARRRRGRRRGFRRDKDLALWIDEKQVKLFSGMVMEIYAIHNGRVLPHILDPNFEKHLPVIPSEVETVNFTWKAGHRKYLYDFDRLSTYEPDILNPPVVSVVPKGRVPRKPKVFTVQLPCTGRATGVATFGIGLRLQDATGHAVPGTPLHLTLSKMCRLQAGPTRECDRECENGGRCGPAGGCECPEGYMGPYCNTALCYPQCMNGGTCTAPGRCSCPPGFQGRHCEGGICSEKCLNGGKCIQKDTCSCRRGYYGNRCEFSKCVIPCLRGGRCKGVNTCRCPAGYAGHHCEIEVTPALPAPDLQDPPAAGAEGGPGPRNATRGAPDAATARRGRKCSQRCRQGVCTPSGECQCLKGFSGRWCRSRNRKQSGRRSRKGRRSGRRKKIWV